MKFKRLLVFLLALVMLLSVVPAVYAADIDDPGSITEPTVNASDQEEQTEPSASEESTEPPIDEYNGELDPILAEAGFTSNQLQAGTVRLEPVTMFKASTRSVKKTATLRNCDFMDFPCTDGSRQGFHYADEDGKSPWDYMNMIYCLENKKSFSIGSGHSGVGDLPIDGSGSTPSSPYGKERVFFVIAHSQGLQFRAVFRSVRSVPTIRPACTSGVMERPHLKIAL